MAKRNNSEKRTLIKKSSTVAYIVSTIIALIVIFGIFFLLKPDTLKGWFNVQKTPGAEEENLLASVVNGEPIYMADLDKQYESLPAQLKLYTTKQALLDQMVDEKLLLQEAEKKKISVTNAEVDSELATLMTESGLTMADLETSLAQRNTTIVEFKEVFKRRLVLTKLYNETVLSAIQVTNAEAKKYYDDNQNLFEQPEMVNASHILVKTEEEAKAIKKQLEAGADFAKLAKEKSIEPAANTTGGNLGFFAKGAMIPEFENASFALKKGEISEPVETQFGWHIIKVLDIKPAGKLTFAEAEKDIIDSLRLQKSQTAFDDWIAALRKAAKITTYYKEENATEETNEATGETISEEITATEEVVNDTEEIGAQTEVTQEPTGETVTPEEVTAANFADCLTKKGAILYGAYWNKDTKDQLAIFGDNQEDLDYVECGIEGDYAAQTKECTDAGIKGYPTWKIGDRMEEGLQTKERLSALTGCK